MVTVVLVSTSFAQTTADRNGQSEQLNGQEQIQKAPPAAANPYAPTRATSADRLGTCSEDEWSCIQLTGRVHLDLGDYLNVKLQSPSGPHSLNSGATLRRAQIGVSGKVFDDWHYALIGDFGGSTDSGSHGIDAGRIESAFISYQGLKPLAFEVGFMNVPFTLEGVQSSNDILFLERASVGIVGTNIAAGDFRSAAGIRANDDRYWAGAYATGPQSGALHSGSNKEQLGAVVRGTYQVLQSESYSLHLGLDEEHVFNPRGNGSNGASKGRTLTFSDRPELRVDPTVFLTTGALPAKAADIYGVELAATYANFFFQGEAYHFTLDQAGQTPGAPAPTLGFGGGYVEGSWTLTGERRSYLPTAGGYGGIKPAHPLSLYGRGWGAWEAVARWSYVDLNSHVIVGTPQATTGGVFGGRQTVYSLGLNWYPLDGVRLMLDYLHADVDKLSANGISPAGVTIDALALRIQIAF
jgi:phosphate-selective porin OprO/OprP